MTFSMLINTVGDRRQHDTYLDNLTQLKQAYFTWQAAEAEKPTRSRAVEAEEAEEAAEAGEGEAEADADEDGEYPGSQL